MTCASFAASTNVCVETSGPVSGAVPKAGGAPAVDVGGGVDVTGGVPGFCILAAARRGGAEQTQWRLDEELSACVHFLDAFE